MRRSRLVIALIKGSAMSGSSVWAIVGAILLVLAAAIVIRERRPAARS